MERRMLIIASLAAIAIVTAAAFFIFRPSAPGFHEHADFAVFVQGAQFNFSQGKYMEKQACGKPGENADEKPAHLHNGIGWVVHTHNANVTWGEFFSLSGMKLDGNCFETDANESYCTNSTHSLKMRLNGLRVNGDYGGMIIGDLDQVLVSYGVENETQIAVQEAAVTNQACVYSGKCPARNEEIVNLPPEEDCAG